MLLHGILIRLFLSCSIFFLKAASFQLSFLATSCVAFLVKTVLHLQFATQNVFSLAELDLPIDWLPIVVVFEIQALVATQSMCILKFFVPNFGSPCRTQSSILFYELNLYHEQLVELFVPSVL